MSVPKGFRQIRRECDYETRWIVVNKLGAIDFHCTNTDLEIVAKFGRSGGVEIHRSLPDDYQNPDQPDHLDCWILGGKCWHDGSSLWASEHWIPMLESNGEEAVWQALYAEHKRQFGSEDPK